MAQTHHRSQRLPTRTVHFISALYRRSQKRSGGLVIRNLCNDGLIGTGAFPAILGLWRQPPGNPAFHPSFQRCWSTRPDTQIPLSRYQIGQSRNRSAETGKPKFTKRSSGRAQRCSSAVIAPTQPRELRQNFKLAAVLASHVSYSSAGRTTDTPSPRLPCKPTRCTLDWRNLEALFAGRR